MRNNNAPLPAQLAANIVDRVLMTKSDLYLDSKMHSLSWWQLSFLDVKLFLLLVAVAVFGALGGVWWCIVNFLHFLASFTNLELWCRI